MKCLSFPIVDSGMAKSKNKPKELLINSVLEDLKHETEDPSVHSSTKPTQASAFGSGRSPDTAHRASCQQRRDRSGSTGPPGRLGDHQCPLRSAGWDHPGSSWRRPCAVYRSSGGQCRDRQPLTRPRPLCLSRGDREDLALAGVRRRPHDLHRGAVDLPGSRRRRGSRESEF